MKYEFPWPPRELSPNARVHWRTLARAKAGYFDVCAWTIRLGGKNPLLVSMLSPPVTAQVTFVTTDRRRRDTDNHMAMLKPLWDGMVKMGLLEDDSHDKFKILEPRWERGSDKKVIVELSPYRDGGE